MGMFYDYDENNTAYVVQGLDWYANRLIAGVAIEYSFPQRKEEDLPVTTPTAPVVSPPALPVIAHVPPPTPTVSLRVFGLTADSSEQDVERFIVEELAGKTLSPLLNSIYFDSSSAALPQRIQQIRHQL